MAESYSHCRTASGTSPRLQFPISRLQFPISNPISMSVPSRLPRVTFTNGSTIPLGLHLAWLDTEDCVNLSKGPHTAEAHRKLCPCQSPRLWCPAVGRLGLNPIDASGTATKRMSAGPDPNDGGFLLSARRVRHHKRHVPVGRAYHALPELWRLRESERYL